MLCEDKLYSSSCVLSEWSQHLIIKLFLLQQFLSNFFGALASWPDFAFQEINVEGKEVCPIVLVFPLIHSHFGTVLHNIDHLDLVGEQLTLIDI